MRTKTTSIANSPPPIPFLWMVPVVFLATLVALYRLAYPLLNDNDVPWHLAIGQMLLDTHKLPVNDPWAYGNQDHPWYILSWVWNLVLGIVQKLFGVFGVFIFTLSVGAGLTAAVANRLLARNIAMPAVMMTTILTGLCLLDFITARPQLAGYILAFIYHGMMHKSRDENHYKTLKWMPPLMLLWTNSHGSFMVGFIIMGTYAVEAWFTGKYDWLKRIVITGIACAVCGLINPYGPDVIIGALVSFTSPATRYTAEWMPFSFGTSTGISVWLVMLILASNLRGASVSIADKILAMGWFIGTMVSIRNGAFFILLSAPYLATCLDEQTRGLRKQQPVSPLVTFMSKQPLKRVWLGCVTLFILLCTVASILPHQEQIESEDYSIKDAIDFALEKYPNHHFLSDYNFGGQIIYHTQGKLSYFMDSRASTAYPYQAVDESMEFLKLSDGWEENLRKRHLNGLIIAKTTNFAISYEKGLFRDRWKLVFEGKRGNVYVMKK